jgi:hypothetical protein
MRTRKTSDALTELRTVISRAETARKTIGKYPPRGGKHTPHELLLMVTALENAHDILYRVEQITGYEGKND